MLKTTHTDTYRNTCKLTLHTLHTHTHTHTYTHTLTQEPI
uniref:Uncharacterized protein n=1 Tax=Anguilla anguilla TaxID=7936 RepID=A0A0E9VC50_ANGAN